MGKVRRLRQKYHLACQKSKAPDQDQASTEVATDVPVAAVVRAAVHVPGKTDSGSNIFAGVTISSSDLKQTLLPPTTEVLDSVSKASLDSSDTGKVFKTKTCAVPKQQKRLQRRMDFLKKLEATRKTKEESRPAKRVKKPTPAKPMLMQSLFEALPSFSSTKNDQKDLSKPVDKRSNRPDGSPAQQMRMTRKKSSLQQNRKDFLKNMKTFQTVLSDSHYKADPALAVSYYLSRTIPRNNTSKKSEK